MLEHKTFIEFMSNYILLISLGMLCMLYYAIDRPPYSSIKQNQALSSLPLSVQCLGLCYRAALDPEATHCFNALTKRVLSSFPVCVQDQYWLCTFPVRCPAQASILSYELCASQSIFCSPYILHIILSLLRIT